MTTDCFGAIASLKKETQERLTRMQSLKDKLKRMYPMIKEGSISKKRRKKEKRTKSNKRKMEREEKGCQRVFPAVVKNELSYGNIVVDEIARRTREQQEDTNFQLSLTQILLGPFSAAPAEYNSHIRRHLCTATEIHQHNEKSVNAKERERA